MHKKIVLTGGGTAGHVTPNMALLPALQKLDFEVHYIGSAGSIEAELARDAGLPFYEISVGKLRRSLSPSSIARNLRDQVEFMKGIRDARRVLREIRPNIVFSKGGFVSVPVVIAARSLGIKVIIHESDITPGLANKISFPFAERVCVSFPETLNRVPRNKGMLTGTPLRPEIFSGDKAAGLKLAGFTEDKPILLVMGGSSGSLTINTVLRAALPELLKDYQVAHIVGKGNAIDLGEANHPGYVQFEYLKGDLPHILAAADIVISRAGANAIQELLALRKPSLLIPLSKASRGDQVQNARSFARNGFAVVLPEDELTPEKLVSEVHHIYGERDILHEKMSRAKQSNACDEIIKLILSTVS